MFSFSSIKIDFKEVRSERERERETKTKSYIKDVARGIIVTEAELRNTREISDMT